MGWTSYHARNYSNGTVDRKAECDALWNEDKNYEIVESSMRGSVWYGAVRKKASGEVFAAVMLTSVNMNDWYDFSYKDMDETCGPSCGSFSDG